MFLTSFYYINVQIMKITIIENIYTTLIFLFQTRLKPTRNIKIESTNDGLVITALTYWF